MGRGEEMSAGASTPVPVSLGAVIGSPAEMGIRISGVSKAFGGVQALNNTTFEVKRGELVALLGPSGCGKSTLLRVVAGLIDADAGEVEILGRKQTEPSPDVSVVFQTHNLLPWLTVEANIQLAAQIQGIDPAEIRRRVDGVLPVLRTRGISQELPTRAFGRDAAACCVGAGAYPATASAAAG